MRAHIVLAALQTQNRFALCHLAFKSIRLLHKPSTRIADTTNDVLQRLAGTESQPIAPVDAVSVVAEVGAIGAVDAILTDNEREHSAGPSTEPLAEAVGSGDAAVILPAESPES